MKNILIYTGPSCNFCDAAKRLLERNKLKFSEIDVSSGENIRDCLLYRSPSPRDGLLSRMPSSA